MIDVDAIRQRFQAVAPFLDERGRRLVAASEVVAQQAQDHRVSHSLLGDLLKGLGRAVADGVYDIYVNAGWVSVGIATTTPPPLRCSATASRLNSSVKLRRAFVIKHLPAPRGA
jgi:hypothetical protein